MKVLTGVRVDHQDRITHVRWAEVDPANNKFVGPEVIVKVIDVVDVIVGGGRVETVVEAPGGFVAGPSVQTFVGPGGLEGIEAVPGTGGGRTLLDLPRV